MPVFAKARIAIAGAEFPKRGEPGRGVVGRGSGAGGNQPALGRLAEESLLEKPHGGGRGRLLGRKHAPPAALQFLELLKRSREFFVHGGHGSVRTNPSLRCRAFSSI